MSRPTRATIDEAFAHGVWLRGQVCTGEGRMLADLSYEVQALRVALERLMTAEEASIERFNAREISALEQAMAHAADALGERKAVT